MNKNTATKSNDSSERVLNVLKILIEGAFSQDEILQKLQSNSKLKTIYTKEAIIKYFNTLKICGFELGRKGRKYYLKTLPEELNLDEKDVFALNTIVNYAQSLEQSKLKETFFEFLQILESNFSPATREIISHCEQRSLLRGLQPAAIRENCDRIAALTPFARNDAQRKNSELIKKIETYCSEELDMKITYSINGSESVFLVKPKFVKYKKDKAVLCAYNCEERENQEFYVSRITNITQLPTKSKSGNISKTILFKIKGTLVNAYRYKEGENIVNIESDGVVVSNSPEDKNALLKRLLRYGENCEVLQPLDYRERFIKQTDEILANYEN